VKANISQATGQYLQIDRPHRLIFTFGMLQLSAEFVHVVVDIARAAGGSELTLTHEYLPWMGTRSPEKGWHAMFDMLGARPALTAGPRWVNESPTRTRPNGRYPQSHYRPGCCSFHARLARSRSQSMVTPDTEVMGA